MSGRFPRLIITSVNVRIGIVTAPVRGYVLVGGRSSRFGTDKAFLTWKDRPLAVWAAEQVRAAAGSVTLVGSPERYAVLGLRVIPDREPGCGPLGGLATALEDSKSAWNLVVACDMPHVRSDFLEFLCREGVSSLADVLLPLDREGREEPLCAVYSSACRGAVAEAVGRGVRKVTDSFSGLRVRRLGFAEYEQFDPQGILFANLNTPADLAAAEVHG